MSDEEELEPPVDPTAKPQPAEKVRSIHERFAAALRNIQNPKKNRTNPFHKNKYADLAACMEAVKNPLLDEGLYLFQKTVHIDAVGWVLRTIIANVDDNFHIKPVMDSLTWDYPLDMSGKPQDQGSAVTYARRYALCLIGLVAEDDDDGNVASGKGGESSPSQKGNNRFSGPPPSLRGQTKQESDPVASEVEKLAGTLKNLISSGAVAPAEVARLRGEQGVPTSDGVKTAEQLAAYRQFVASVQAQVETVGASI